MLLQNPKLIDITPAKSQGKALEYKYLTYDPAFNDINKMLDVIREFITKNNLIVYGGTALDMALRMHGDKIYPDELPSDLDFYSAENIKHAYEIADILFKLGYNDTRTIMAAHIHTMRVDLDLDHYIADISYQPKEVFDIISTLKYQNMRIVHPFYQRIDQHSALSYPYDNPPKEVIFARWRTDIKRFNLSSKYYKFPAEYDNKIKKLTLQREQFPIWKKIVYSGFAAYALIYYHFDLLTSSLLTSNLLTNNLQSSLQKGQNNKIIRADIIITDNLISFETLNNTAEVIHFDVLKCSEELKLTDIKLYEPFGSLIPEKVTGYLTETKKITIVGNKHRLISVNSIQINGYKLRMLNVQPLLKYFLALFYINVKTDKQLANTYLEYYFSLIEMINVIEKLIIDKEISIDDINGSPLFLSIETYGSDNVSLSTEVQLGRLYAEIDNKELEPLPINYYPARSFDKHRPTYDYNSSHYFRERGYEIK